MAISLDDSMRCFNITRSDINDPMENHNPLKREIRAALDAKMPEREVADILVSAYREARERAADRLDAATEARKARIPIKATPMPR